MEWFQGTINDAIAEAKVKGAVFMVAVHGESNHCKEGKDDDTNVAFISGPSSESSCPLLPLLNDPSVMSALSPHPVVAIKLEQGTPIAKQFSAIYPIVLVPSVYFIDSVDGVNMEITGGEDVDMERVINSARKVAKDFTAKRVSLSFNYR